MTPSRSPDGATVGSREAKDALFDAFATVGKALSSGRRAEILEVLAQGERSVEDLSHAVDQSVANTSHHLQVLARAGLVRGRREGNRVHYRLASPQVEELWAAQRELAAAQVAEVDRLARAYLGDRLELEAVDREELARRLRQGSVVVLDVRPRAEFDAGHITGARSVPLEELGEVLAALPDDVEVVAYCRGPYCVYADEAVRRLRSAGFQARRLEDGFPEWRRQGLPVTGGD